MRYIRMLPLMPASGTLANAQPNTAATSGSIGKCAVRDYPCTLYNSTSGTRSMAAVDLSGSGAMAMSRSSGITLSYTASTIHNNDSSI